MPRTSVTMSLRKQWKELISDTWRAFVARVTLTQWRDLFCWRCNEVKSVMVWRFVRLRNMQATMRSVQCPTCGDRLLWPYHMRQIRCGRLLTNEE